MHLSLAIPLRTLLLCSISILLSFYIGTQWPLKKSTKTSLPCLFLEYCTSHELDSAIKNGIINTVLIPTGGVEQNGPYLALGKHNAIIQQASEQIALQLGKTVIAPIIKHVPQGSIDPPQGHMEHAGTISLKEGTYIDLLEDTANSLKQHGFKYIIFIGDSGGNQLGQRIIAHALTPQWIEDNAYILHANSYYGVHHTQELWMREQGYPPNTLGHAGLMDGSELLIADRAMVRKPGTFTGLGKKLLDMKVSATVEQIQTFKKEHP